MLAISLRLHTKTFAVGFVSSRVSRDDAHTPAVQSRAWQTPALYDMNTHRCHADLDDETPCWDSHLNLTATLFLSAAPSISPPPPLALFKVSLWSLTLFVHSPTFHPSIFSVVTWHAYASKKERKQRLSVCRAIVTDTHLHTCKCTLCT